MGLLTSPLFHVSGCPSSLVVGMLGGVKLVIPEGRFDPAAIGAAGELGTGAATGMFVFEGGFPGAGVLSVAAASLSSISRQVKNRRSWGVSSGTAAASLATIMNACSAFAARPGVG